QVPVALSQRRRTRSPPVAGARGRPAGDRLHHAAVRHHCRPDRAQPADAGDGPFQAAKERRETGPEGVTIPAVSSNTGPAAAIGVKRPTMILVFATIAILQLATLVHREVNWDEFHYLSLVFEHRRGELHQALQTFHVHLFSWLTLL